MVGLRQRYTGGEKTNGNADTTEYGRIHDEEEKKHSLLGFRHWFFAFAVIGVVYGGVVFFHQRLPDVKPAGDYSEFSEVRARALLKQIVGLGPRPSGSAALEKHAMSLLQGRLESSSEAAERVGKNRVEIDTQHPTGCFDLKFLSAFTLCYQNVTNKIARIGPAKGPAAHSLLLNCHMDTFPDTPGATDDAVSCAIMMDILDVLAREEKELQYDVVFLFNGAEENFLQGSHGFIENHPWRHTIRAFINLEGTGSGGREILFQAGPGNSWLLQAYLDAAPHPYCSILAQEIFQSGIIPADTDFRIFRDFGKVSGLDIAYTRNGWVYHTEFDTEERIDAGSIQRAGDNILAVVRKVLSGNDLSKPGKAAEQNKWVFYDVVGLFTVQYTVELGVILNVGTAVLTIFYILERIRKRTYSAADLLIVFFRHVLSLLAMAAVGGAIAVLINVMDLIMCWYALPELIGGLYVLPMFTAGLYLHELFHTKQYMRNAEMVHFDSVMVILAAALLWMTHAGLASAFFLLNYLLFAMLRDPIILVMRKVGAIRTETPFAILAVQMLSLIPAMIFASYAISQCVDFFVPVIGRLGKVVNPEAIMAPLSLVIAFIFVLFTNNLVYISRPLKYGFRFSCLVMVGVLIALSTTNLGVPYKFTEDAPRVRRLVALHTHRTVYSFDGQRESDENALFIQPVDYRGARDLPAHSFLSGPPPSDCEKTKDEYCRMPYYTAFHELLPPSEAVWVAVPAAPIIPHPIQMKLLLRERVGNSNLMNMTFELDGGYDKMSLHVTALNGFELKSWSFTQLDMQLVNKRVTYFVFLTYGNEAPPPRKFWLLLEQTGDSFPDVSKEASLELAVVSHHAHGEHQNSETLRQLRSLISSRRQSTHFAVGWWKWAITLIGGVSEIVVKQY